MRAVVFNLGCKVNQYESDMLGESLLGIGYEVSYDLIKADVYILNTCAVTNEAERKSRQAVARCRALNPDARIFVCGCASQKAPDSFRKDNVVYVVGTTKKQQILEHLTDFKYKQEISELPLLYEGGALSISNRTRAYVKIQDGCDSFCSYCIIPYLRGRSRSRKIEDIVTEIKILSEKTQEIVLTGINLMSYGKDIGTNLTELIMALQDVDVRIRLGSFYAEGITEDLASALFSLKKFCPHFHLSLQSGDAKILHDMNRHYTPEIYAEKIELIRQFDPNSCITTDIITGYPTEEAENHRNTISFVNKVNFSDIHVFPYSTRAGTRAGKLPRLPNEIVKQRRDELLCVKNNLHTTYLSKNKGIEQLVLLEEKIGDYYCGYSQYYIRVYTKKGNINEIVSCIPTKEYKDGLLEE